MDSNGNDGTGSIPNFVELAEEDRPDFESFRNAVIL
jgi:hypothetical protein